MDLTDFYARLAVKVTDSQATSAERARVAELLDRSAEFALNDARWSDEWLVPDGGYACRAVEVEDRFGRYGLAGAYVTRLEPDALVLVAFTLNCRVLGKQVELILFKRLAAQAMAAGRPALLLEAVPTRRNEPFQRFLAGLGVPADGLVRLDPAEVDALPLLGTAAAGVTAMTTHARATEPLGKVPPRFDMARIGGELSTGAGIARAIRAVGHVQAPLAVGAAIAAPAAGAADMRELIGAIWAEVLGTELAGSDENFFDLGGHSIAMLRVYARLRERFSRELTLTDLFRYPTVRALADFLAGTPVAQEPAQASRAPAVPGGPIAVVGLACRVPGARDAEDFWQLIRDGREGLTRFGDSDDPSWVPVLGWVDDLDRFDADFFGLTPREAQLTDPQQRVLLECAWQALEDAARPPEQAAGRIGVYAGTGSNDHLDRLLADDALVAAVGEAALRFGNFKDYLATRVAYRLDLRGPAVTVQTACSSSLVAVHLAVQALRAGECDLALAGGTSFTTLEPTGYRYERGGIFAPDGHCRAFSADAAGTVPGNGAAVVVLRRLDDAVHDGDPIRAVIVGSAVNNDGSQRAGFTAPGVAGQAEVLAAALADAGLRPGDVEYAEAHGTGTALGDPIELTALQQVYGRRAGRPLAMGSVKSNVGHLDAAAGVVGLVKAVLTVQHGELPPAINVTALTPAFDFAHSSLRLCTELEPWPDGAPCRAGVSSFGIGGTNAHVIVERAPKVPASRPPAGPQLVVASAHDPDELAEAVRRLGDWASRHPGASLAEVAATTRYGRRAFRHRAALACTGLEELAGDGWMTGEALDERPAVLLFPGQGSQFPGMAAALHSTQAPFRAHLDACLDLLPAPLRGPVRAVLLSGGGLDVTDTAHAQPALFAVEYALARMWEARGVRPVATLGHSIGEYVSATLAGVFSLAEAVALVAERGRVTRQAPPGAMLVVACDVDALAAKVPADLLNAVDLAAVNAPDRCVLAGPVPAVEVLAECLNSQRLPVKRLAAGHAFHSRLLEPVLDQWRTVVSAFQARAPRLPYPSNATGTWVTADDVSDPEHWVRHLRGTVRFADGVAAIRAAHPQAVWLECGPGRTLTGLVRRAEPDAFTVCPLPARLDGPTTERRLRAAEGRLWCAGIPIGRPEDAAARRISMPGRALRPARFPVPPPRSADAPRAPAGSTWPAAPLPAAPRPAAPRAGPTGVAGLVALIWTELLGVAPAGADDDFIELGGDSLAGIRYVARLAEVLGVELPVRAVFDRPTLAAQAELVAERLRAELGPQGYAAALAELEQLEPAE